MTKQYDVNQRRASIPYVEAVNLQEARAKSLELDVRSLPYPHRC